MNYSAEQRLEAAQWFFDVHDAEDPSQEFLQEWLRWLDACEGNRLAFEAVESAYHQVPAGLLDALKAQRPGTYDGSVSVAAWSGRQRAQRVKRARILAVAAAAVLAVLGVGVWTNALIRGPSHPSTGDFTTRTGEHLQLMLADGSRVELGARSRLEVNFSARARDVRLVAGEAFFQVHKDAMRAFRVHALQGMIIAVGTAFNVRTTADHVTVAVSEGNVNVVDAGADAPDSRELAPSQPSNSRHDARLSLSRGEQLTFVERPPSPQLEAATVTHVDPAESARWRDGWLVYRDEPLRYVIADVERYTDRQIAVADSLPADLRFTGVVSRDSVVEWIEALPEVFPVIVQKQGQRILVIAPSKSVTTVMR